MTEISAPQATATGDPPAGRARMTAGFWLVTFVYALVMLGGTLPIPLYVLWAPRMGFGPFTTTLVFAVYALGTVLALLVLASWSDRAGRRPLLAYALLTTIASTVLFLLAQNVAVLLAARFLCGLATGVFTATATAALGELAGDHRARRASIVSTAANMGGLGLGTVLAGLLAQFSADPTHVVFWCYLAALVPAPVAIAIVPETVAVRHRPTLSVRRPSLPPAHAGRPEFLRASAVVFSAFAVCGLFSSLVPAFLRDRLHVHSLAAVGGQVGALFIVGVLAQLTAPPRWLARQWPAPSLLIAGVAVFQTITTTQRVADPKRRADLLATYFLAAYAGLILPTLTLGVLDQAINQNIATSALTAGVVTITLAAVLRPGPGPRRPDQQGEAL